MSLYEVSDILPGQSFRARGRRELVVWLKHLENRSSHAPDPADPLATYDFAWIWQELGIAQLRGHWAR